MERHAVREESWDSLHYSEVSNDSSKGGESEDGNSTDHDAPTFLTIGDVQRAIHPLQATADRVGKQVERFAETLDRLNAGKQQKRSKDCRNVLPSVYQYEKIASDTVTSLRKTHGLEKLEKSEKSARRKGRSTSGKSTPIAIHEDGPEPEALQHTTVEDLQHWEEERQTWRLLSLMLEVEYPTTGKDHSIPWHDERFVRPSGNTAIHQYSPEHDIWQHFLAEDDSAWDKHVVLEWLKTSADNTRPDIHNIVKHLEDSADRSGLWKQGWLYSREEIKNMKRLRSWPQPIDPNSPGIDSSLAGVGRTGKLVTQLDPDVFSRQSRNLLKEDVFYERTMWLTCWEMMRRGHSWEFIRDWCQERAEGWRALSMRGDPRAVSSGSWRSRALWRSICAKAAKSGGIDDYENAVYGVLSGDLPSVEKVSSQWDDYLFAHYNSYLLRSFDRCLESVYSQRLSETIKEQISPSWPPSSEIVIDMSSTDLVNMALRKESIRDEARQPLKLLQASLIAKRFRQFVHAQGLRLAQTPDTGRLFKDLKDTNSNLSEIELAANITIDDYDMLRILTHMIFVFQDLENPHHNSPMEENIIIAYVEYLGRAGKQQLLPLYVSRLSRDRAIECMGRQLRYITDPLERQITMQLMKQYNMDLHATLSMQLVLIVLESRPAPVGPPGTYPRPNILDHNTKSTASMRSVRKDFIGHEISGDEQDLINGFGWFLLLDGHWQETMSAGTLVYKYLLQINSLAAAREFSNTITFSIISRNKTSSILGRSVDITAEQSPSDDESHDQVDMRRSTRSRSMQVRQRRGSASKRRSRVERDVLLRHANSFRDFENLMLALDALEHWKDVEAQIIEHTDPRHARAWKKEMQVAHDEVIAKMEPLLHDWLQYPRDDAEATEFQTIKVSYLPEMILAYNSVLNFGGHALSRDNLLKCMDLAATVAAEESELADVFLAAGRISELVDSMAISSKSILCAEESGRKSNKKTKRQKGETMEIWSVKSLS